MVADLMPASSPGSRSTTSALKPARSHQRRYMRMSICAQSCDSVPPAPGWMERMAAFASCGPESITFSSNSSSSRCSLAIPSRISASTLSSPASPASSSRTARSEAWLPSSVTRATRRASSARSRISSCARRLSSQKAGDAISASSAARRASLAGRSKVPPELVDASGQLRDVALEIAQHLRAPGGSGAGPPPRPRHRGRRHRQREQAEPVAEPCEERPPRAQRHALGHDAALEEVQAAHDDAAGRDEGGDARVGGAHDAHAMLDRAERVHREMLRGPARPPEPRVVRHVHHQQRAVPHELSEQIGEDALVTGYDTEGSRRSIEDLSTRPGLQLGDELGPAAHEPEHSRQRHELPERNELNFIISPHDPLIGDEERAVAEARGVADGVDAADEHRHAQLGRGGPEALDQRWVAPEDRRRRRLRPDDQVGMLLGDTLQQREVDAERLARVAWLPLEWLLDRGLDERDANGLPG